MQISGFVALALATTSLWTVNDPFVGKWKVNPARSRIIDRMQIDAAGPNTYAFRFEGSPAETVITDGNDQPSASGTTLAVTITDARHWKVVRKQAGQVIITANWTLSQDGATLRDSFNGAPPFGSGSTETYTYRRTSGTAGVTGAWESTDPKAPALEIEIRPNGTRALSFITPVAAAQAVKTVIFDGQDHQAGAARELTASGHRTSVRTLDVTDKAQGQIVDTRLYKLSVDGKSLTLTIHVVGQKAPNVLLFERE
jgi:hypothetical protein